MFRFENEYILYGLLLLPIFIGLFVYVRIRQKRAFKSMGEMSLIGGLMPDFSRKVQTLKFVLVCLSFCCLVFALANPQLGSSVEKGKRKGIDIMFCVDVSNSMLARDFSPDRLSSAKRTLLSFVDKLKGDRIGIVVFAGKSFVQLPITSDYAAAKMFISNISTRLISEQGTDIAGAIDNAAASMLPTEKETQTMSKTNKVIVVISDGEDHSTDAIEITKAAAKRGIQVFTIGIGNQKGEPIPVRMQSGQMQYKKDREGNTVITRLNEQILKDIAHAGNGVYIRAGNSNIGFDMLYKELEKIEKSEIEDVVFSKYDSKYQIPLFLALFFLLLDVCLYNKKMIRKSLFAWLGKSKEANLLLVFMISIVSLSGQTTEELKHLRQGNKYYYQGMALDKEAEALSKKRGEINQQEIQSKQQEAQQMYEKASTSYLKSNESNKDFYKSIFNQGTSLYKQGNYEDASKSFEKIANMTSLDKKTKSKAYHNLGNSQFQQQKYKESIDAYKNALKLNPSDMDSKYNLEYAKRMLVEQRQQQQQQDQQQDKNDQQQNQQNGQQQQNQDQENNQDQQQNQQQQDKKEQQQKEKQQNQQQQQQEKDAKRQLDALQQNERKTQEKVKETEMQQIRQVKQEKDW